MKPQLEEAVVSKRDLKKMVAAPGSGTGGKVGAASGDHRNG